MTENNKKKRNRVSLKNIFLSEAIDQFDLDQENLMDKGIDMEPVSSSSVLSDKDRDDGSVVLTLNFLVKDAAEIVSYKLEELGIEISDESVEGAIEEVLDFAMDEFGEITATNLEADLNELSPEEKVALVTKIKDLAAKKAGLAKEELQHSQTGFADVQPAVVKEEEKAVDYGKHLRIEARIEKEMRKVLEQYRSEIVVDGKKVFDMASDLVDLVQGEIYELDNEAILSHQDYLDMAHDVISDSIGNSPTISPVRMDKDAKMDRMDLDADKFDLMESEGEESPSSQHLYEKALEAVKTANSYVTHDDPNMAAKMSSIARDYAEQMKAPELYNADKDELADELVHYFISSMTDENQDYQDAMLEPDDKYSNAAEAAGMHREEAYVFSKFPKRLLARAITEFYSR